MRSSCWKNRPCVRQVIDNVTRTFLHLQPKHSDNQHLTILQFPSMPAPAGMGMARGAAYQNTVPRLFSYSVCRRQGAMVMSTVLERWR